MNDSLKCLINKGVVVLNPEQVYISPEVNPDRIYKNSILYPGTRLTGSKTLIGSFSKIGSEGPAVIQDSIIGSYAEVASGFLTEAALLPKARAGANSHFRAGTLLEEEASTAHCVGLKQSILMYGVTMGSLINFCDVLISGGRSRQEHTEVGSGFIHFNFTPWGVNGDKATPSLVGTVTEGVFLDQDRIFLGGLSGMVGPISIGFGAMTAAGQVIRRPVADSIMHAETGSSFDRSWSATQVTFSRKRLEGIREKNCAFISQVCALKAWYSEVRQRRSRLQNDMELSLVLEGAVETIQMNIQERMKRYNSFAEEWSLPVIDEQILNIESGVDDSKIDWKLDLSYYEWVRGLEGSEKNTLFDWISQVALKLKQSILA